MDTLPQPVLSDILEWMPLADVACAAAACRALCGAARTHTARELAAREVLRREYGPALDLSPEQARTACRDCRLPATLSSWLA